MSPGWQTEFSPRACFMDETVPCAPSFLQDTHWLALAETPSLSHAMLMESPSFHGNPCGSWATASTHPALAFGSSFVCGPWEFIQHFYVFRGWRRVFHINYVCCINWASSGLILSLRSTENLSTFSCELADQGKSQPSCHWSFTPYMSTWHVFL